MRLTVSKSPDVHVLPARRGEIKTCDKTKRDYGDVFRVILLSNSTLSWDVRPPKCGLTVGSEGRQDGRCDQLLHRRLHPPLPVDHPGGLRQTAAELVVPPWTTRRTSGRKKTDPTKRKYVFLASCNTCHKDRHVETLDVLRAAAAGRLRWWTRVVSENNQ